MIDSIAFYTDEQFPRSVVQALRDLGVDILTTQEANRYGTSDPDQLAFAASVQRILVTQDVDFLQLNAENYAHIGIVFVPQRTSFHIMIEQLALIAGASSWEEFIQQVVFVPLQG